MKENIEGKFTLKISRRGKEQILLLNVNPAEEEGDITDALRNILEDDMPDLTVIRQIKTRIGKTNWLIDTNRETLEELLPMKYLCIGLERVKIVKYIDIPRCNRCQDFGHRAFNCRNEQRCAKCTGKHGVKDCKATETRCTNCFLKQEIVIVIIERTALTVPLIKNTVQKHLQNAYDSR